eukprot:3698250-Rhodomonas_salina.2
MHAGPHSTTFSCRGQRLWTAVPICLADSFRWSCQSPAVPADEFPASRNPCHYEPLPGWRLHTTLKRNLTLTTIQDAGSTTEMGRTEFVHVVHVCPVKSARLQQGPGMCSSEPYTHRTISAKPEAAQTETVATWKGRDGCASLMADAVLLVPVVAADSP